MIKAFLQSPKTKHGAVDELPEPVLPYVRYRRSQRARRLSLRLDYEAQMFILTLPPFCSMVNAEMFLMEHQEWMEEKLEELPERVPFDDGVVLPILGQDTELLILYNEKLKRTVCDLDLGHYLTVKTNKPDPTSRIERFLKKLAKEEMSRLAHEKAAQIEHKIQKISVRDTKSRWGSCSEDGHISLSWRLIFAPYEAMDYVVAHEVAHLEYLDHSKAFWRVCKGLSEDYESGKSWMREHGQDLMRFG